MFTLDNDADTNGITTMGEIELIPARLITEFDRPAGSDGYMVSGEYVFVDSAGQPFVVHDWKSTSLWDAALQSPDEFWASEEMQEFCIATRDLNTTDFEAWLLMQLK